MKKYFFLFIFTFIISSYFALASNAEVSFKIPPGNIVSDVPFDVEVQVNTNNVPILDYDLLVKNEDVVFNTHSGGKFSINPDLSGTKPDQHSYRYYVDGDGTEWSTNTPTTLFTLKKVKIPGIPKEVKLQLDDASKFTPALGYDALVVTPTPLIIVPKLSVCGDGVVGYFDEDKNGLLDASEKQEACEGTTGCQDCKYIEIGYEGKNCEFGSRNCQVTLMDPQDLFLAKVTALVKGQCYPNEQHPAALYCDENSKIVYTSGKLNSQNKIKLVKEIGNALKAFFLEVVS